MTLTALVYNGHLIGDRNEKLCLTDMWRAAGADRTKRPVNWLGSVAATEFAEYLSGELKVRISDLVLSERDALERFAEKVGEGAVKAAREFLTEDVKRTVEPRFDRVEERLATIERLLPKNRRIGDPTKVKHVDACRLLGGRCPCCGTAKVIDDGGGKSRFSQFDHFFTNQVPDFKHTWLICTPCHSRLSRGQDERNRVIPMFTAYHAKCREFPAS